MSADRITRRLSILLQQPSSTLAACEALIRAAALAASPPFNLQNVALLSEILTTPRAVAASLKPHQPPRYWLLGWLHPSPDGSGALALLSGMGREEGGCLC